MAKYRVVANYASNESALVSSENVYDTEEAGLSAFQRVREAAATISASIMLERDHDGQIESVVLDMAFTEGVV